MEVKVKHPLRDELSLIRNALTFSETPITDYRSSLAADRARYIRFTTALLDHGVRALERGAWFLSSAHTDELIDETIAAVEAVAKTI